ncbi:hypothetical protein J2S00_001259 [Caldalkalibacillus uzonensis]|uniref:Lipoprotein n=1 Tax=Caldalkalibacillus uzonensis TaxID=353224 RepID=A0ABU0CSL6_9BACI|nr:hypothetical protein [Caldalkalibacillus uzonensis]MDQ0338475.1 hypothetical protein [Caldalkalibacillus uzonensis]
MKSIKTMLLVTVFSLSCLGFDTPRTALLLPASVASQAQQLPQTKTVPIMIEGMEEEITLHLHEAKQLGFYTYIPQDMTAENKENALLVYFNPGRQKVYKAKLKILAQDGIESVEEMADFVQNQLEEKGFTVKPSQARRFGFSAQEFSISKNNMIGKVSIFEHNERVFGLIYHYPPEYGDGFETRMETILDEIVWYESDYK